VNARRPPTARRRPLWVGVLAVAVFGLRALIPTGCMLAAIDGHARLVLCPAGIQWSGGAAGMAVMAHGSGMDDALAMHHAGHAASGAAHCPYALAGGAGLVAASHDPGDPSYSLLQPERPTFIHSVPIAPPLRHHAPRGPPSPA
jgi:hypothetical protein